MEKEQVIEFLEEKVQKLREDEPYATITIAAFEQVISSLANE